MNLMMLRGQLGKPGAGLCPVRGHSNVQGDRTMGIWEQPSDFSAGLAPDSVWNRRGATVTTPHAIRACTKPKQKSSLPWAEISSATPDTEYTAEAQTMPANGARLNQAESRPSDHGPVGRNSSCPPNGDRPAGNRAAVRLNGKFDGGSSDVRRKLAPASDELLSEPAIVAGLAKAVLGRGAAWWEALIEITTDSRRDQQVVRTLKNTTSACGSPVGLSAESIRERQFKTRDRKAHFTVHPLPQINLQPWRVHHDDAQS